MKWPGSAVIRVPSKARLAHLIKKHGLQTYLFNSGLLTLSWNNLEFSFQIRDERLYLDAVYVRDDVDMGPMEKYETDDYLAWVKMRYR